MCFCHQVELKRLIVGHGEDMGVLPDGHFDAVVLLFVLCSAKDGSKLLSECKRVLKKDPAASRSASCAELCERNHGDCGLL
ncbi:hypothetical protein MTO96_039269 [Rhipicephalus appendiculatus]